MSALLSHHRRLVGVLLVAYGVVGMLACVGLAVSGAAFVDATRAAVDDLDAERTSVVSTIAGSELVIDQVADGVARAEEGLSSAAKLVDRAGELTASLAETSRSLAGTLNVEILGQRPFASVAESVGGVATTSDEVSSGLDSVAAGLARVADQAPGIATGLQSLRSQLADARARLGVLGADDRLTNATDTVSFAIAILDGWIGVQALGFALVGLVLLLGGSSARAVARDATREPGAAAGTGTALDDVDAVAAASDPDAAASRTPETSPQSGAAANPGSLDRSG